MLNRNYAAQWLSAALEQRHWQPVKKGELLAEIDTPEVDQELSQPKPRNNRRGSVAVGQIHCRTLDQLA